MRIFCITQEEPFYLPIFWERIFKERARDIIGVCILPPDKSFKRTIQRHYNLYGPWLFLMQSFLYISYKLADVVSQVLHVPLKRFYSVKAAATYHSISIYKTTNINSLSFIDKLKSLKPELIISVASSQVFGRELLKLPPKGCINVHSALLPRYRGMLPSFWVLLNNERETGVTVHYMDEKLDNGDIILQEKLKIKPEDTHHSIIVKTKKIGSELLVKTIEIIERETVTTIPNDSSQATYFSFPTREDARKFHQIGRRFR